MTDGTERKILSFSIERSFYSSLEFVSISMHLQHISWDERVERGDGDVVCAPSIITINNEIA